MSRCPQKIRDRETGSLSRYQNRAAGQAICPVVAKFGTGKGSLSRCRNRAAGLIPLSDSGQRFIVRCRNRAAGQAFVLPQKLRNRFIVPLIGQQHICPAARRGLRKTTLPLRHLGLPEKIDDIIYYPSGFSEKIVSIPHYSFCSWNCYSASC